MNILVPVNRLDFKLSIAVEVVGVPNSPIDIPVIDNLGEGQRFDLIPRINEVPTAHLHCIIVYLIVSLHVIIHTMLNL